MLERFFQRFKKPEPMPDWTQDFVDGQEEFRALQTAIGPRYILLKKLAYNVYLASGPDRNPYQLKVVERGEDHLARAKREYDVYRHLGSHPNLGPFVDADFECEAPWMARPERNGVSLTKWLEEGPQPLEFVVKFLQTGLDVLEELADKGILYRIWDPAEILLCDDQWVFCGPWLQPPPRIVAGPDHGGLTGLHYMAPETITGSNSIGPESDLFSLGALLFHLLAGQSPFHSEEPMKVLLGILQGECPDLATLRPDLPQKLTDKIHSMLRKEPSQRAKLIRRAQPPPSEQVAKFLEDASKDGTAEGIGKFTLDPKKALEKLRTYQFRDSTDFLYAALCAAPGLQAQAVSIKSSKRELQIQFEGATVDLSDMESALLAACRGEQDDPMNHLGLALVGALGTGYEKVELIGAGHRVTFTDLTEPTVSKARGAGLVLRCQGGNRERELPLPLHHNVSLSKLPIRWNGKSLSTAPGNGTLLISS